MMLNDGIPMDSIVAVNYHENHIISHFVFTVKDHAIQKNRLPGQNVCPVARSLTERQTYKQTESLLRAPLQDFRISSFKLSSKIGSKIENNFTQSLIMTGVILYHAPVDQWVLTS